MWFSKTVILFKDYFKRYAFSILYYDYENIALSSNFSLNSSNVLGAYTCWRHWVDFVQLRDKVQYFSWLQQVRQFLTVNAFKYQAMDAPFYSSDYIVLMACMKLCQTFREGSYTSNQQLFVASERLFLCRFQHHTCAHIKLLHHHQMYSSFKCKANGRHQVRRCCGVYYKVLFTMCFFGRPGFKSRKVALVWHKNDMKAPK